LIFSPAPVPELLLSPAPLPLPVTFRLATPADLAPLHASCFPEEPFRDFAARYESAQRLQDAGRLLHVLACAGEPPRPVASGQVISYSETVAEIADLIVAGELRGEGVGTALVRVLGALAAAAGAQQLELAVRIDNDRALALYRRLGFRATRLLRFPSGERAILLGRPPWPVEEKDERDGAR
jgi:ribosomal protein S18 acetylase RimI-like enzyme